MQFRENRFTHAVAAGLCLCWVAAGAARGDGVTTTVSGFGTVGGTFTSDGNFAYRHDSTEFIGAMNQFDVGLESRLGVQAVVDFGSGLSVTAQEVFKQRGSSAFSPGTEWFFGQYSPVSSLDLRIGRFAIDTFLLSDSLNVGYAAVWFRAPNEIYASEPFKYLDGGQGLWRAEIGPVSFKLEGAFGTTQANLVIGGLPITQSARYAGNIAASVDYKSLLFRVAKTDVDAPLTLQLGPHSVTYTTKDSFTAVGLQYDDGHALMLTEWTKRSQNDIPIVDKPLAASSQWYVAGGRRFGRYTPMVTYGDYRPVVQLISPPGDYRAWSEMLRFDVIPNVDLKAEYSRAPVGDTRYFVTPNFKSDERVGVFSLGADFVF